MSTITVRAHRASCLARFDGLWGSVGLLPADPPPSNPASRNIRNGLGSGLHLSFKLGFGPR